MQYSPEWIRYKAYRCLDLVKRSTRENLEFKIINIDKNFGANKRFFSRSTIELQKFGFTQMMDFTINVSANVDIIARNYISDDGEIISTAGQMKVFFFDWLLLFILRKKIKYTYINFSTEFKDQATIITSNLLEGGNTEFPPFYRREYKDVSINDLFLLHKSRVEDFKRNNPDFKVVKVKTNNDIFELEKQSCKINYEFRKSIGWITLNELIKMGYKEEIAKKIYQEIQNMNRLG